MNATGARAPAAKAAAEPSPARTGGQRESATARVGLGNQATQADIRSRAEARLGLSPRLLRIDQEGPDGGAASALGARAATSGSHVVLGPQATGLSLAHELIHVAQAQRFGEGEVATVSARDDPAEREARRLAPRLLSGDGPLEIRERPGARWQKDDAAFVIVPVAGTAEPLAAYAGLRERLSPSDWNALNAAARRRADTIASGAPPAKEKELVKTEVNVPLNDLFQPPVTQSKASGGDQWLRDIYALGIAGGAAASAAMGAKIQDEILYRWIAANQGVLEESVTIALVDPEAKGGGPGGLLAFTLRGRPVSPTNGLLTLSAVDRAIGGTIDLSISQISGELNILAATIEKAGTARAMLAAGKDVTAQGHEKIAARSLDQIDAAMRKGVADLGGVTGNPFSELVEPTKTALNAFIEGDFAAYRKADADWRAAHPREKSGYEKDIENFDKTLDEQKRMMKGGIGERMLSGYVGMSAYYQAQSFGTQNLVMGGAPEQGRQLGLAYDQGLISYQSWSEGVAAAERRGYIFAAVTGALTIATLGLGIYLAPATLGGAVLFGASTGFVVATAPMLASNLYTSSVDFADPALQTWWKSGSYSAGDIALAGLLGAGIGAALPIAGKLLGGLRGQGALAVAALEAGAPLPEGVVARTVSKGVVELTIASEGVTIRVSQSGYQVIGRAGANAAAVLEEGVWPAELAGEAGLGPGARVDIAHPRFPSSVAFGQRGWGLISPQSSMPIQFGMWPELALPGGIAAEPAATVSPLLLDAAAGRPVTAIAGSDSALVLAGANIPQGVPMAPPPIMLGAGPVPFGYLPQPLPEIGYFGKIEQIGPLVPDTLARSLTDQWGREVARRGVSMLPFAGEGGQWLRLPSGVWAPAYYSSRPGGIPNASFTTYGGVAPDFILDVPGSNRSALVQPRPGGSYPGPRLYPMPTSDMFDPLTGMTHGRGHMVPHAATKQPLPGQTASTLDPHNFVAHPRKYNEWIRNQLEQMLKREGATYTAHDVIGANPRFTTGGYIIPEAEVWVQYGPSGAPVRAWRFPLAANPSYYETLTGSFKDVLGQFEIKLANVPTTPIRK